MDKRVAEELERVTGLALRTGLTGKLLTTFCIGGPIHCVAEPNTIPEVQTLLRTLSEFRVTAWCAGAGSNLLISDNGVQELCIRLGPGFRTVQHLGGSRWYVGGAMSLMTLSRDLSDKGFSGIEFAGGIPASFGGAIRMNAGAHGGEISQLLESVTYCAVNGEVITVDKSELQFAYRRSIFPAGVVILGGIISLILSDSEHTSKRRAEFLAERKKRQPLTLPSAGSVFKNPSPEQSAGYLIEQVGLRGEQEGGARVSELHGNWIVNPHRTATAGDVHRLMQRCMNEVREKFGLCLEPEIISIDE